MLLNYGSVIQAKALDEARTFGVDVVHADIGWRTLAPRAGSRSVPKVNLSNPRSYRASRWAILDSLVRGVQARGMRLLLTPSTPGPTWATGKSCTKKERRAAPIPGSCRPNARLYGKFVTALARRYTGTYVDPRQPGSLPLPRVDLWSFVNEPNLSSWLYPASIKRGKRFIPISARLYRGLLSAGAGALRKFPRHKRDEILLGETGPIGGGRSAISPVPFYQAVFCIDSRGRRLRGSARKLLGCPARLKRLPISGVAHHTYTRATVGKLTANPGRANATIGALRNLRRVLKQGVHAGAISAGASSRIQLTEFGVSSRPPAAKKYGVSLSQQAARINLGEYLAYRLSYVRSFTQFALEDDNLGAGSHPGRLVFQTGLRFIATRTQLRNGILGKKKPSYNAYRNPLFVVDRGRKVTVWGGVRGVKSGKVKIAVGGKTVKTVSLKRGYFSTTLRKRKGSWQTKFGSRRSRKAKPAKI
jgi:hypothetical protein